MSVLSVPAFQDRVKPFEKKVGDLMLPLENFLTVSANTSLKDALYILERQVGFTDRLLVFKNKRLVGMLRYSDILELFQPPRTKNPGAEPLFFSGFFTRRCLSIVDKPVRDAMYTFTFALQREDTLCRAVYLMIKHRVDLLPVREGNRTAGILRSRELSAEASRLFALALCNPEPGMTTS